MRLTEIKTKAAIDVAAKNVLRLTSYDDCTEVMTKDGHTYIVTELIFEVGMKFLSDLNGEAQIESACLNPRYLESA